MAGPRAVASAGAELPGQPARLTVRARGALVVAGVVPVLRERAPGVRLIAAGGITAANAAQYAATGVDALATSWMYAGRPADVEIRLAPIA